MVKKDMPKDVVLFLSALFVGVLFLWTNQSGVYTLFDFYVYIGTFVGIVGVPLCYSVYVVRRGGKKKNG